MADENYFYPMLTTIKSICHYSLEKIDVRIFTTYKISSTDKEGVAYLLETYPNLSIQVKDSPIDTVDRFTPKNHVSKAAFLKVLLPELNNDWDKCIYLDGDVLLLEDIKNLWLEFKDDKSIYAVRSADYYIDNHLLGLAAEEQTFNSGVMLMNLSKMRVNSIQTELIDFLSKFNKLTHLNDQAAFNSVLKDDWEAIDIRWNVCIQFLLQSQKSLKLEKKELINIKSNPFLIHFNGSTKPWYNRSSHPYTSEYNKFKESFEKSHFNEKKVSLLNFLKEKFAYSKRSFKLLI